MIKLPQPTVQPASRPQLILFSLGLVRAKLQVALTVSILAMGIFSLFGSSKPDPDEAVLSQLKKAGSDLSKPHDIEFFLYFPSQAAAEKAAEGVRADGFQAAVKPPIEGSEWLCLATKRMVPDLAALQKIRDTFERLTWLLKGKYDGWGTSVEK